MNKLNTTLIGNNFEDKVFDIISSKLSNGELFLNGKLSKPFKKKAYYSKDREKNIITDVSIETTLPDADNFSILTVFECKNYGINHTVPIDDIEEFVSKLSQIAGHNIKGVMVTSSCYTKTGITYARNKGIALIRIIDEKVQYEVYRKSRFGEHDISDYIISALEGENISSKNHYIADKYFYSDNLQLYFLKLNIIDKVFQQDKIKLTIPYLSLDEIENITQELLPFPIKTSTTNLHLILDSLKSTQNIEYIQSEDLGTINNKDILGKISFKPTCIHMSDKMEVNSHRWRFTLAHELGHCILHTKYLTTLYDEIIDTETSLNNSIIFDDESMKRIEYQANIFASSLLMPSVIFKAVTYLTFKKENVNRGRLYLDNQFCNQEPFYRVVSQISKIFNVSIQAVKYRMIEFKLLEDTTTNSFRDLLDKD